MAVWIIFILLGLSSAVPSSYRIPVQEILPPPPWNPNHHRYQRSTPLFQRGAVESPPTEIVRLPNDLDYDEFGSHRYPLRDAVEASPGGVLSNRTLSHGKQR